MAGYLHPCTANSHLPPSCLLLLTPCWPCRSPPRHPHRPPYLGPTPAHIPTHSQVFQGHLCAVGPTHPSPAFCLGAQTHLTQYHHQPHSEELKSPCPNITHRSPATGPPPVLPSQSKGPTSTWSPSQTLASPPRPPSSSPPTSKQSQTSDDPPPESLLHPPVVSAYPPGPADSPCWGSCLVALQLLLFSWALRLCWTPGDCPKTCSNQYHYWI